MKKLFTFFALTLTIQSIVVAQINSTGIDTDWSSEDSWDCGCIPGPADNVIINADHFITTSENAECNNLTINGGFFHLVTVSAGDTLNINGAVTIQQTSGVGAALIFTNNGVVNVAGSFGGNLASGNTTIDQNGEMNLNLASGNNSLFAQSGTVITWNVSGDLNVASNLVLIGISGGNVSLNVNDQATISSQLATTIVGSGSSVTIDVNDTLIVNNLSFTNPSAAPASSLTLDMQTADATVFLNGTLTVVNGATINADASNTSSFYYNGSATQSFSHVSTFEYHDLYVSNASGLNLSTDVEASSILGDLRIASGGILNSNNNNIYLNNDFYNQGTLNLLTTDTFDFVGTGTQTVFGTSTFDGLFKVSNTNVVGGVVLDASSDVTTNEFLVDTNGVFSYNQGFTINGNFKDLGTFNGSNADTIRFLGSSQNIEGLSFLGAVQINNNTTLNLNSGHDSLSFGDVSIETGSTLNGAEKHFSVQGNWLNNAGSSGFNYTDGSRIRFNSTTMAQTIDGDTTNVYNILLDNTGGGLSCGAGAVLNVYNVLDVENGTFNLSGSVYLKSNATGTAVIGNLGAAPSTPFSGNLIAERFLNEDDSAHWYTLAPQVTSADVGQWANDTYTSGFPDSEDPASSFVSISYWDEAMCDYATPTGFAQSLNHATSTSGWYIYDNTGNTITTSGTPASGDVSISGLSFTSSAGACTYGDGWNLLGNPYAAHLYVDSLNMSNITGADGGAIYVLQNDNSGNYVTYNGDGAGDVIASGEAFFVQAVDGTASIDFQESDKVESAAADSYNSVKVVGTQTPTLSINLDLNGGQRIDEAQIVLNDQSTVGYDWNHENSDFGNENNQINIATLNEGRFIELNALPSNLTSVRIPLVFYRRNGALSSTDTYQITFNNLEAFTNQNKNIVLEDSILGTFTKITTEGQAYAFTKNDTVLRRLFLNITSPLNISQTQPTCANSNDGMASVQVAGVAPYTFTWIDENNDTLRVETTSNSTDSTILSEEGIYKVEVLDANLALSTALIEVIAPLSLLSTQVTTQDISCYDANNGSISVLASNGNTGKTFAWSNGQTGDVLTNLSPSTYFVTITETSSGCSIITNATINQGAEVIQDVITTNNVCSDQTLGAASVSSTDPSATYTYGWSNGDTTAQISNLTDGNYQITLTNTLTGCSQTESFVIASPTELLVEETIENISCFGDQNGAINLNISGGITPYVITWGNSALSGDSLSNLSGGSYVLQVTDANACVKNYNYTIEEPAQVIAGFNTDTNTLIVGEEILFNNTSQGATTYAWDFGNGNTSTVDDPTQTYQAPGLYTVSLVSSNENGCDDVITQTLSLNVTVGLNDVLSKDFTLQQLENETRITSLVGSNVPTAFTLYNALGQVIGSKNFNQIQKNAQISFQMPSQSGIYLIEIKQGERLLKSMKLFHH